LLRLAVLRRLRLAVLRWLLRRCVLRRLLRRRGLRSRLTVLGRRLRLRLRAGGALTGAG
jgi:hypothetical protein